MAIHWHLPDPSALLWESWGSEYSLFDRNSGETHLINLLPAEILHRLADDPKTLVELADTLAEDCEMDASQEWREKIQDILFNLHDLGLIEKAGE